MLAIDHPAKPNIIEARTGNPIASASETKGPAIRDMATTISPSMNVAARRESAMDEGSAPVSPFSPFVSRFMFNRAPEMFADTTTLN